MWSPDVVEVQTPATGIVVSDRRYFEPVVQLLKTATSTTGVDSKTSLQYFVRRTGAPLQGRGKRVHYHLLLPKRRLPSFVRIFHDKVPCPLHMPSTFFQGAEHAADDLDRVTQRFAMYDDKEDGARLAVDSSVWQADREGYFVLCTCPYRAGWSSNRRCAGIRVAH